MKTAMFLKVWSRLISVRNDSRGVLIVITALLFPVLLAFLGLALDVGMIYDVKRRQQNAANAAAIGGAYEILRCSADEVSSAALDDAKRNGFDVDGSATTVAVTYPYTRGAVTTTTDAVVAAPSGDSACGLSSAGIGEQVEVVIDKVVTTYFMRVLGYDTVTVQSRAVAGVINAKEADGCVIILDRGETRAAFKVPGTADFQADCGIKVNSKHRTAAMVQSGNSTITASGIGVTGECRLNGGASMTPYPVTGMPAVENPYWHMAPPDYTDYMEYPRRATDLWISETPGASLEPGYYKGGIKIDGLGTTVHFNPGVYILDANADTGTKGGLQITGSSINSGDGVMFYSTNTTGDPTLWGDFSIAGSSQNRFTAPAEGSYYAGMLFWNDESAPYEKPGSVLAGTSDSLFEGVFYLNYALRGAPEEGCAARDHWAAPENMG